MISEQVLRDLREIASMITRGLRSPSGEYEPLNEQVRQFVFRTLPALLDEVELYRPLGDADRVQHIPAVQLAAWRDVADRGMPVAFGEAGPVIELAASALRDLLDYCAHVETARVGLRLALKHANEQLAERDTVLAKDFAALWQAASSLTAAWHPAVERAALWSEVERLGLQVRRLAPLYDDVRMRLGTLAPQRPLAPDPYPIDPAHTVTVQHEDGSTTVECDHTFPGTTRCAFCGIPFDELRRRHQAALQTQLGPDAGALFDALEQSAGSGHTVKLTRERRAIEPQPDDRKATVVTIALGPTLRSRAEAVVGRRLLGDTLASVVQTMFILGLLEAEGLAPDECIGEPVQHVSVDAAFIRFALPHDPRDPRRREVLQNVFAWLHSLLADDPQLAPAPAAALAALPR